MILLFSICLILPVQALLAMIDQNKGAPTKPIKNLSDLCFDRIYNDFSAYEKDLLTLPEEHQRPFFEKKIKESLIPFNHKTEDLKKNSLKEVASNIIKIDDQTYALQSATQIELKDLYDHHRVDILDYGSYITNLKKINSTTIAFAPNDGTIALWDFNKRRVEYLPGHSTKVLFFTMRENNLLSISYDGTIKEWDLATKTEVSSMKIDHHNPLFDSPFINNFKKINHSLYALAHENIITIIDFDSKEIIAKLQDDKAHQLVVKKIDDNSIVSGDGCGNILLWNLVSKKISSKTNLHKFSIDSIQKVGNIIISAGFDGSIKLFDYINHKEIAQITNNHRPLHHTIKRINHTLISNAGEIQIHLIDLRPLLIEQYPFCLVKKLYDALYKKDLTRSDCHKQINNEFYERDAKELTSSVAQIMTRHYSKAVLDLASVISSLYY